LFARRRLASEGLTLIDSTTHIPDHLAASGTMGRVILIDRPAVIAAADEAGIAVFGVD
jgi:DUF1009 family protein